MQDQILDMLLKRDEITWQDLIKDLVKSEGIDPWNVDISLLAKKYVDIVKQLKEVNFFVSGKVVLAASIFVLYTHSCIWVERFNVQRSRLLVDES